MKEISSIFLRSQNGLEKPTKLDKKRKIYQKVIGAVAPVLFYLALTPNPSFSQEKIDYSHMQSNHQIEVPVQNYNEDGNNMFNWHDAQKIHKKKSQYKVPDKIPNPVFNPDIEPFSIQDFKDKYVQEKDLGKSMDFPIIDKDGNFIKNITSKEALSQRLYFSKKDQAFYEEDFSKEIYQGLKKGFKKNNKSITSFYGDQVLDPFSYSNYVPPSYAGFGEDHGHHYSSADATDEGEFYGPDDYDAMVSGNFSDRTDLNADANLNNDLTTQHNYFTDVIDFIPGGHWEFSTEAQKTTYFEAYYNNINMVDLIPPGPNWDCGQYELQFNIENEGIWDIQNSPINLTLHDPSDNGRSNLPVYGVGTMALSNEDHRINAILVGDNPLDFDDWYFYEPQNDTEVEPGDFSMHPNQYVDIDRYCYFYHELLQQFLYGYFPIIDFDLTNGNPSLSWQHPDLVTSKPVQHSYTSISGTNPADIQINPEDPTGPGFTGSPGADAWATEFWSDTDNRSGTVWDSTYWNYDIIRPWWAISDSSARIFRTYGSNDATNFPNDPSQVISVRDTTNPVYTSLPEGSMDFSDWLANGVADPTGTDNCGYVTLTVNLDSTNKSSNILECGYYDFTEWYSSQLIDPTGNITDTTYSVQVNLDPIQFTYVPPSDTVDYWIDWTDPANTGGYATAMNPAGNSVSVSIADSSLQDPDPTVCEHYNFPYFKYHWASNDLEGDCEADSVYALQHVWVKEELAPSRDYTPGDTIVPIGGNIHPDFLGWSYGTDTISNVTPIPQYWDDVLYQGYDSIYVRRSHWVEDICGTPSDTGYQYITQMVMPWIFEGDKEKNIKVYPNPVDDLLNVIYDVRKPTKGKMKLVDHYGRTLKEEDLNLKKGENKKTYDLREYAPAMYYLNITTPEKTETRKVIKN